jgi:hypothetical protein
MDGHTLPDAVGALLRDRIGSFEQLEILLLLHQHRERAWTPHTVGRHFNVGSSVAAEALDHLCRSGLLDVSFGNEALLFRYNPATPVLDDTVKDLARA